MIAIQASVSALIKGGRASIASFSADRSRATVRVTGADAPGVWFLYGRAENSLDSLDEDSAAIGMRRMHPVRMIHYKAAGRA